MRRSDRLKGKVPESRGLVTCVIDDSDLVLDSSMLSNAYLAETVNLTYREAVCESNSDRIMWRTAMADEFESLLANGTWTLVKKAKHMRVIPVRWVFAKKLSPDSQKVRFKARLVAKGFKQRPGIEYQEVYDICVDHR